MEQQSRPSEAPAADLSAPQLARLRARFARSERERALLRDELREAKRHVEEERLAQQSFVRMIAHELLTPVTAIELSLRLVERMPVLEASRPLSDAVARMSSSSRRLHQVVETMSEWSSVRSGTRPYHAEPIDLAALTARLVDDARAYAARKGLVLTHEVETAPPLLVDRSLLTVLLGNLLTRALQASNEGEVCVRVRAGRSPLRQAGGEADVVVGGGPHGIHSHGGRGRSPLRQAGGRWIEVTDTAAPIRAEHEVFDRLSTPTELRRIGAGSGLSPSMLRDLAAALGGTLTITPQPADPGQGPLPGGSGNVTTLWVPERDLDTDGGGDDEHR